jgi:NifU-like protein involved in Fe-S cluster formation
MKSKILIDHFLHPRNMGELKDPTHQAMVRSETCSDIVKLMVSINGEGIVRDVKAQVFGCGYAIAAASLFTESVIDETVSNVLEKAEKVLKPFYPTVPEAHKSCLRLSHRAFSKILLAYHKATSNGQKATPSNPKAMSNGQKEKTNGSS